MASKIQDCVLAFTVGVGRRFPDNLCSALQGMGAMGVDVFDSHEDGGGGNAFSGLGEDDCAVAYIELRAVVSHLYAQIEAEGLAEPLDGLLDVRIGKFGNYGGARDGAVGEHAFSSEGF
jgi:hypothetical protein